MEKSEKIETIKLFSEFGLPVVPFEILDKESFEEQIIKFSQKHSLNKFIFRTGSVKGKILGNPSIVDAQLNKDREYIKTAFDNGYVVMIMIYVDIYHNLHNLNVMKVGNEIVIEAVGQGFISRDLNLHGHLHEEITLRLSDFKILERKIVSSEKYKKSKQRKIKEFDIKELEENKSFLLNKEDYIPLADYQIAFTKKIFPKMEKLASKMGYKDFVANLSFVDFGKEKHQPVFWDLYEVK